MLKVEKEDSRVCELKKSWPNGSAFLDGKFHLLDGPEGQLGARELNIPLGPLSLRMSASDWNQPARRRPRIRANRPRWRRLAFCPELDSLPEIPVAVELLVFRYGRVEQGYNSVHLRLGSEKNNILSSCPPHAATVPALFRFVVHSRHCLVSNGRSPLPLVFLASV